MSSPSTSHAAALEQGINKYKALQLKQAATGMLDTASSHIQDRREATTEETRGAIREELQHVRPRPPPVYDGYGFRPASGVSTPIHQSATTPSSIPDVNGLGWPGKSIRSS
jgi:GTP cyclohydrolase IA